MLGEQIIRQWKILQHIQRSPGVSITDLSQIYEVTERTIRRDLDALSGPFPIYSRRRWDNNRLGWFFVEGYKVPQINFTQAELMALLTCRELLPEGVRSAYRDVLESAFEKLESTLTKDVKNYLERLRDGISSQTPQVSTNNSSKVSLLQQAIGEGKTVGFTYHSFRSDRIEERQVDPYHVRYAEGSLYLIGYCHLREQIRTFTIDNRMTDVLLTDTSFERPETFSIDEFLQDSFGIFQGEKHKVVIRFEKFAARYVVNKAWHTDQEVEELEGGEILVTINVSGLQDVERWVFGFGGRAEVLEPPSFREKFRQEVRLLAKKYGVK